MKKWIKKSFHRQLLVCFGVVALLPLLLFGVFLIQSMETKINSDYEKKVTEQAEQIDAGILELFQEFETVVENINANTRIVEQIGEDDTWSKSKIYLQFYREVADYREYAQFDLYDKNGKCIYTTAQGSAKTDLPVYWGILKAVEDSKETLVLRRADTNDSKILLYAAGKLMGKDGIPEGYIVISMRAEHEMEKVLFAADELTGLIWAAALMRPSKSTKDMELKSLKKKYKSKGFAAGCSREVIERGAAQLNWELEKLLTMTLQAMAATEDEIKAEMEDL
jgi:hypothetical protein